MESTVPSAKTTVSAVFLTLATSSFLFGLDFFIFGAVPDKVYFFFLGAMISTVSGSVGFSSAFLTAGLPAVFLAFAFFFLGAAALGSAGLTSTG